MSHNKITRRPDFAGGGITHGERTRLAEHAALWTRRILRTDPVDPAKIGPAIGGLYAAAGLPAPRVIIVPSPLVMAVAGGLARAIILSRDAAANIATYDATRDAAYAATHIATYAATYDATDDATCAAANIATRNATYDATYAATDTTTNDATRNAAYAATYAATYDATRDAAYAATRNATDDATRDATYAATHIATYAATYDATDDATCAATGAATADATYDATSAATGAATDDATYDATSAATDDATLTDGWALRIADEFGVDRAVAVAEIHHWTSAYQGGAYWAQWDCYLTAARDILGLRLDAHTKYAAWEAAAIEGGPRYLQPTFCMVSDFPEFIRQDAQHRPHCADGPSHRWRDGWSLYYWHGVAVPAHWVVGPKPTPAEVLGEKNAEKRRAGIEILGWAKIVDQLGGRVVDEDADPMIGTLFEVDLPDAPGSRVLRVRCGTGRDFAIPVPESMASALEANAWTYGIKPLELRAMQART